MIQYTYYASKNDFFYTIFKAIQRSKQLIISDYNIAQLRNIIIIIINV